MFIEIITVPAQARAFKELELIRKSIIESVFPVLNNQEGWIKTDVIFNKETRHFKVITYWSSQRRPIAFNEKEPKLSSQAYIQIGKFAEYFENENVTIEYFYHLEAIEKSVTSES